jgi:hypothetical protein
MTTNRRTTLVLAILMVLAATAVVAYADGGDTPPGHGIAQVGSIEPEAVEAMAVLDEPRVGSDALPADVEEDINSQPIFGMNPDLSRLAIGNLSNSVYVVPADDHVCLVLTFSDGGNFNCSETSDIASGQSAPTTVVLETGDIGIYGAVPDGVASVAIETGTSDSATAEVAENVYYAVVEEGTVLREVAYIGPSGTVEFPIYDPSLPAVNPEE